MDIHQAAYEGNVELVESLLQKGVNPNCFHEPTETTASANGNVSDNSQIQSIANVSDVSDETGGEEEVDEWIIA